jgi:uncharacterized protein YbjT (DUF2867 family)/uncharacterized membrane protein YphA (DoxX/SURF4 family)
MIVLLTGASGFIGQRLAEALQEAGHDVIGVVRQPALGIRAVQGRRLRLIAADFTRDHDPHLWIPRLAGVDAVINAVGILREDGAQTFEAIHVRAPQALFAACHAAGVRRVVQISALGADEHARSPYHLSKRRADSALAALPLDWTIVQPSLVYGPCGASAQLFTGMASLPWIPMPGRGDQQVQPVHLEDLVAGIVALLERAQGVRSIVPFVGPEAVTLRQFLLRLRGALGLPRGHVLSVPLWLVAAAARLGRFQRHGFLDADTLEMLLRGNTGDSARLTHLLGRELRPIHRFVEARTVRDTRTAALLWWLLPVLRWSIAAVWIVTGLISFGLYPTQASYELLARVGVPPMLAPLFLYGAASLDVLFGIGTLALRERHLLWLAQAAVILGYTAIITWRLPDFWLHPFGPLLKNVPMLAAILLLDRLERHR